MDQPGDQRQAAEAAIETARAVLEIARRLARERRGDARPRPVSMADSLERDLGLDSLGRLELLQQIERRLDIHLPVALVAEAERLRDVVDAVLRAQPKTASLCPESGAAPLSLDPVQTLPEQATTLLDAFAWHLDAHPDRTHLLLDVDGDERSITYGALWTQAGHIAAALGAEGIAPGDTVAIMLPTDLGFFAAFIGTLRAGAIPVPLYPPFRRAQIEEHLRRQERILANARARALITFREARPAAALLRVALGGLRALDIDTLLACHAAPPTSRGNGDDTALLQYTSGSTGQPKGVVLTHANLLANVRAMGRALDVRGDDVFVSWLPLYHDMGLIGAWLGSLYHALPAAVFSPVRFVSRPVLWLRAIHRHRGTLSAAPNFAYELCARRIADADLEGLDLSSWRCALNGAEAVRPATLERFAERFAPYGFRRDALMPVYGLAECSVGLAFPPPGRGPRIDRISRSALAGSGVARMPAADVDDAIDVPSCGSPLDGHAVRIVDAAGQDVPEREQGRLLFRGPSATPGYHRNDRASRALRRGAWLDSGDLAYLAGGELYLTGRAKDMIVRAGRNIYPQEIEEAVADIPGVRRGCVAVFGATDPHYATERVVVLAETRERDPERLADLRKRTRAAAAELLDSPPDDVVLAPPNTVLKTSSGKIRRAACRELYETGRLGEGAPSAPWQIARLVASAARARVRRAAAHARAWIPARPFGASRERASREGASRERASREGASREGASREGANTGQGDSAREE